MSEVKKNLFGTDGIRGKANIYPMTGEVAMSLGRAITYYFQKKLGRKVPLIIIGKDTRLSCYMLEQAVASGVCSQGGRAILTGPLPTPGVAFVTQSMRGDVGVVISASHNDYMDNGIKIFDNHGYKLPDEVELELEQLILNPDLIEAKVDDNLGRARRLDEVVSRYVVYVKTAFPNEYSLEGIRVAVDCANGAAYKVAPMVFSELGADVIPLSVEPNGININKRCGALHPDRCAEAVVKFRADVGICLDGDADRVIIINEKGRVIHGDLIIALLAKYLKDTGQLGEANEVVGTVMSNLGLEKYLEKIGVNFNRTKVGDRYIIERMKKSGAMLGGEPSGHIIFKQNSTTGDGIMAALKVIALAKYYGETLEDMLKDIVLYPQVLKNVFVARKVPFEESKAITEKVAEIEKRLIGRGRILLRYSGTENKARVMLEGDNLEEIDKYCDELVVLIAKELG